MVNNRDEIDLQEIRPIDRQTNRDKARILDLLIRYDITYNEYVMLYSEIEHRELLDEVLEELLISVRDGKFDPPTTPEQKMLRQ